MQRYVSTREGGSEGGGAADSGAARGAFTSHRSDRGWGGREGKGDHPQPVPGIISGTTGGGAAGSRPSSAPGKIQTWPPSTSQGRDLVQVRLLGGFLTEQSSKEKGRGCQLRDGLHSRSRGFHGGRQGFKRVSSLLTLRRWGCLRRRRPSQSSSHDTPDGLIGWRDTEALQPAVVLVAR